MSGKSPIPTRDSLVYEGVNVIVPVGGWQFVRSKRDPTTKDKKYPVGTLWINTVLRNIWFQTAPAGLWTELINSGATLVQPANGGTGVSSPTAHTVAIAEGSSPFTFISGTDGQVLTGNTGADPGFAALGTNSALTAHGVVVAEGASAFAATAAGTTGQVLTGNTGADPAFAALGTNSALTAHGVLLGEGNSAIAASAAGTNGQVLLGSTGADPAFGTLTSTTGLGFTTGAASLALNVTGGGFKVNAASAGVPLVVQNSYTVTQAGAASFSLPATANPGDMFLIAGAQSNAAGWTVTQGVGQEIWSNTSHSTSGAGGSISGAKSTSVWLICTVANVEFLIIGNTAGITFT